MTRQDIEKVSVADKIEGQGEARSGGNKEKLNWQNTFLKMFIDCITLGALVNTVIFLGLMGVLKGNSWGSIFNTVEKV